MSSSERQLMKALTDDDLHGNRQSRRVILPYHLIICSLESYIKIDGLNCGRIDICAEYYKRPIIIEVKGNFGRGGTDLFWDATKVLAYAQIKSALDQKNYDSGILLPRNTISTTIMALSIFLEIYLFAYYKDDETKKFNILSLSDKNKQRNIGGLPRLGRA